MYFKDQKTNLCKNFYTIIKAIVIQFKQCCESQRKLIGENKFGILKRYTVK